MKSEEKEKMEENDFLNSYILMLNLNLEFINNSLIKRLLLSHLFFPQFLRICNCSI